MIASLFTNFLNNNFGFPGGGLYANLIASALLGLVGFLYGRAFERRAEQNHERRHKEMKEHIRKIHAKLDKVNKNVKEKK